MRRPGSPRRRPINIHHQALKERWVSVLRGQLKLHGIQPPELVEEHRFLDDRKFRFDFALPGLKIGMEVEGGVFARHAKSRHTSGAGYQRDAEKYNLAAIAGWLVLRFTSPMLMQGQAVFHIQQAIAARKGAPS